MFRYSSKLLVGTRVVFARGRPRHGSASASSTGSITGTSTSATTNTSGDESGAGLSSSASSSAPIISKTATVMPTAERRKKVKPKSYRNVLHFHVACEDWESALEVFSRALLEESRELVRNRNLGRPLIELCVEKGQWDAALSVFKTMLSSGSETTEVLTPALEALLASRHHSEEGLRLLELAKANVEESHSVFKVDLSRLSPAEEFDLSTKSELLSPEKTIRCLRQLNSSAVLRREAYPATVFRLCEFLLSSGSCATVAAPTPTTGTSSRGAEEGTSPNSGELTRRQQEQDDEFAQRQSAALLQETRGLCVVTFLNSLCSDLNELFYRSMFQHFGVTRPLPLLSRTGQSFLGERDTPTLLLPSTSLSHFDLDLVGGRGRSKCFGQFGNESSRGGPLGEESEGCQQQVGRYHLSERAIEEVRESFLRRFTNQSLLIPDVASVVNNFPQLVAQTQRHRLLLLPSVLLQLAQLSSGAGETDTGRGGSHTLAAKAREHTKLLLTEGSHAAVLSFTEELATQGAFVLSADSPKFFSLERGECQMVPVPPTRQLTLRERIVLAGKFVSDSTTPAPQPADVLVLTKETKLRQLSTSMGLRIAAPVR